MNLTSLSDKALLENVVLLAQAERDTTLKVLHHLREVERRMLFAKLGFSSLYEYAVKELKYSESSAHRRISSMRLLKTLPELEQKVESGALPLSTLSQAQSFFRQEKIVSSEKKIEILTALEGKSVRDVEKTLVMQSSQPLTMHKERIRPIAEDLHHVSLMVDADLMNNIEELKALVSHQNPGMSLKRLLELAVQDSLEKRRVKKPKLSPPAPEVKKSAAKPIAAKPTRYIPVQTKRRVWHRDDGQCTYIDKTTGRRCHSRHFLQIDHIEPFALGGGNDEANLRLRCAAHNRFAALEVFGSAKMQSSGLVLSV